MLDRPGTPEAVGRSRRESPCFLDGDTFPVNPVTEVELPGELQLFGMKGVWKRQCRIAKLGLF